MPRTCRTSSSPSYSTERSPNSCTIRQFESQGHRLFEHREHRGHREAPNVSEVLGMKPRRNRPLIRQDSVKTSRVLKTITTMPRIDSAGTDASIRPQALGCVVEPKERLPAPRWLDGLGTNPRDRRDRGSSAS